MKKRTKNMILAALMLALSWPMPFLAGQVPAVAKAISPMHIPIFICGFVCDLPWAPIVGFIAPLLRSVTTGLPTLYPNALAMAFELAAYGLVTTLLYRALPKRPVYVYVTLICAMLAGRLIWGLASLILMGLTDSPFTLELFISGAFTNAVPGIIFHIAVIPPIIIALRRAKLIQ